MANSSVCWFPDGQTNGKSVSPQFVSCDPTAAQSPCCAYGETCTGNGLCLSGNGLIYRGGCTDSTFKSSACPKNCVASTGDFSGMSYFFQVDFVCVWFNRQVTDPFLLGTQSSFNFLKPCSGNNGVNWVCGIDGDCSNSSKTFGLIVGNPTAWKITGNLSDTITSSTSTPSTIPTSSPTSAASAASSNQSCTSKSATVGAAVGVPLGVLLLLLSVLFLWQRRKGKRQYEEVQRDLNTWRETAEQQAKDLKGWQDSMETWKNRALAQTHEVSAGVVGSEMGDAGEREKDRGPRELAG